MLIKGYNHKNINVYNCLLNAEEKIFNACKPENLNLIKRVLEKTDIWDLEAVDCEIKNTPAITQFAISQNNQIKNFYIKPPNMTLHTPASIVICNRSIDEIIGKDSINLYDALIEIQKIFPKSAKRILVAQNGDKFDHPLMAAIFYQHCFPPYKYKYGIKQCDSKEIIINYSALGSNIMYVPETNNYSWSVDHIIKKLQINLSAKHTAVEDIKDLKKIIIKLLNLQPDIAKNIIYTLKNGQNLLSEPFLFINSHSKTGPKSYLAIPVGPHKLWNKYTMCAVFNPRIIDIYRPEDIKNSEGVSIRAFKQNNIQINWPLWSNNFKKTFPNLPVIQLRNIIKKYEKKLIEDYEKKINKPKINKFNENFTPGNFFNSNDSLISQKFHEAEPKKKNHFLESFDDKNLNYNAKLTMFRYWGDSLNSKDYKYVFEKELAYLESKDSQNTPRITFNQILEDFDTQFSSKTLSQENKQTLEWYKEQVLAFRANPNLWRIKND